MIHIDYKKLSEVKMGEKVAISCDIDNIREMDVPYTDFTIDTLNEFNSSLSVVNFTTNNIIIHYQDYYGVYPPRHCSVEITIPTVPDRQFQFNEFYINFAMLSGISAYTTFTYISDNTKKVVQNLPSVISANTTFHFYESKDGDYSIYWKENFKKEVSVK